MMNIHLQMLDIIFIQINLLLLEHSRLIGAKFLDQDKIQSLLQNQRNLFFPVVEDHAEPSNIEIKTIYVNFIISQLSNPIYDNEQLIWLCVF